MAGLGPVRNPVLLHRVRLFSLVPLVWESNPKLQGGWCKTKVADRFQNIAIISVIPNMVKAGYRG